MLCQGTINDEQHRHELLSRLARQQRNGVLCDVTLVNKGREFRAHKSVLAASSEYFMALFTTTMVEKNCPSVQLNLCPDIIQHLLGYIYTGLITFTEFNVKELIMAADYLLISDLKQKAVNYLHSLISKSNCVVMYAFAVHCNCPKLTQAATEVIRDHFGLVSSTEEFLDLDFELLMDLVSDDKIVVTSEEEVYEAVLRWVKHDVQTRQFYFGKLFKKLHLFSMSKEYIVDHIKAEPLVNRNVECIEFLVEGMKVFSLQESDINDFKPRKCLEKDVRTIILTGGLCHGKSLKSTMAYFPEQNTWHQLADMNSDRNEHAVVEGGGFLYCIGGYPQGSSVERFDPQTNTWSRVADLIQRTFAPAAVTFAGRIYVFGGTDGYEPLSTVQCYQPSTDQWSLGPAMRQARKALCAVSLNGDVYAIGGCVNDNYSLNTVEKLDMVTQEWSETSPMIQERKYACAAVLGDKIVVIGGFQNTSSFALSSCEVYCTRDDQWSVLADINYPCAAGGVCQVEGKVYILGGRHNRQDVHSVQSYDEESGKWVVEETAMPFRCAWFQCGVTRIRKTLIH